MRWRHPERYLGRQSESLKGPNSPRIGTGETESLKGSNSPRIGTRETEYLKGSNSPRIGTREGVLKRNPINLVFFSQKLY